MAAAPRLAGDEREVAAQLVAHLAEIDARGLHVPAGYSSLYFYCREALGYSERLIRLVFIEKVRHGPFLGYGGTMPPFSMETLSDEGLADLLEALAVTGEALQ